MPSALARLTICAALAGGPLPAGDGPVIVELYTSQGCSSCPPADAMLGELVGRDDVLPLALHVDYWDYLGWQDTFADPAHTKRQKRYAHAAGTRSVYTPQIVVGGEDHVVGFRPMKVAAAISAHKAEADPVGVTARREDDRIVVDAEAAIPGDYVVHLVRYRPEATLNIDRGENAGRRMTYHNIVTNWSTVARWDGKEPLRLTAPAPGEDRTAIVIQSADFGPVAGAARAD